APPRNVARNVLRSTAAVLRAEIALGRDRATSAESGAGPWEALFEPYRPDPTSTRELSVEIQAESAASLAQALGWLDGAVLGALLELEAAGVPGLRPDPRPRRDPARGSPHARFGIAFEAREGVPPRVHGAIGAAAVTLERAF